MIRYYISSGLFFLQLPGWLVDHVLQETCEAIWTVLQPQYVKTHSLASEWEGVSSNLTSYGYFHTALIDVYKNSNHLVCRGAIDRKLNAGSSSDKYKASRHSIVLLAGAWCMLQISILIQSQLTKNTDLCQGTLPYCKCILRYLGDAGHHSDGGTLAKLWISTWSLSSSNSWLTLSPWNISANFPYVIVRGMKLSSYTPTCCDPTLEETSLVYMHATILNYMSPLWILSFPI